MAIPITLINIISAPTTTELFIIKFIPININVDCIIINIVIAIINIISIIIYFLGNSTFSIVVLVLTGGI